MPLASTRSISLLDWILCDNTSAIQISYNSVIHEHIKHVEIDCHLTRHYLQHGAITLPFVSSSMQIDDIFTKSHSIKRFRFLTNTLYINAPY